MTNRIAVVAGAALLVLAGVAGGPWWKPRIAPADTLDQAAASAPAENEAPLPVPPVPPRIAEGEDYDHCLSLLSTDPVGADAFADAWEATGGGDAAAHCHGLSQIALGHPATGAQMLEDLAGRSAAEGALRAVLYGQAMQAWTMAGQPDRAYAAATLALSLSPDDPDLLIGRANAEAALGRTAEAIDDLSRALQIDPKRADALAERGAAWQHLGRSDRAGEDIDKALALDPDNADALLERGVLRQRAGDPGGAREDWEKAERLSPDSRAGALARRNLALPELDAPGAGEPDRK